MTEGVALKEKNRAGGVDKASGGENTGRGDDVNGCGAGQLGCMRAKRKGADVCAVKR
jgi:hypothetical protein